MGRAPRHPNDGRVQPNDLTVAYLERRPVPGRHFSMERVFDAVTDNSSPGLDVRRVAMPRSGIGPLPMLRNACAARAVRADVIHVTGDVHYVLPVLRRRAVRVLTIHDLASLNRTTGFRRRVIRWIWYVLPLRTADAVTTVSEETKRQLVAEFGGAAEKVIVVGNPLTAPFAGVHPTRRKVRCDVKSWVVLAVGTGANKNLLRTAEAVRRVGASLRIIGKLDVDTNCKLTKIGVSFSAVHSLTDDDLLREYLRADVLVFASLHEGFGLPILEAQAVGLPVITSDLPPMNEIAAGGAVLVDPQDPAKIAAAIVALSQDSTLRASIRQRGYDNVRRHSPPQVAEGYARVYRGMVRSSAEESPKDSEGRSND